MAGVVSRSARSKRVVAPVELFFDLVYVFAIGQLTVAISDTSREA